jgi:hypothetical protein
MSDPDQIEAPPVPPSPQHRPFWPRLVAGVTSERITAAFTVVLALATLALVITAYFQHTDAIDAIREPRGSRQRPKTPSSTAAKRPPPG